MFGYLMRKTMRDYFSRLFMMIVYNCITLGLWAATIYLINMVNSGYIWIITGAFFLQNIGNGLFLNYYKNSGILLEKIKNIIVFSILNTFFIVIGMNAAGYYLKSGGIIGFSIGFLSIWILFIWMTAGMLVFPALIDKNRKLKDIILDSVILNIKNILPSLGAIALFVLFCFGNVIILFGMSFSIVLSDNLYKIFILKEGYLINAKNKRIKWKDIVENEEIKLEHKSLKEIIFPWKEK